MPPSTRTLALLALLVVGVGLSFSFHAAAGDTQITYEATAVEPGENPALVAGASPNVTDLDETLADTPEGYREPIRTAAADASFDGSLSPELYTAIRDVEAPYVAYDGAYYEWSLSTRGETTNATIEMRETDPETVFDAVACSASEAPAGVRTAIDEGTANASGARPGLYRQSGAYYVVALENEAAVFAQFAGALVGFVLTPVGRGYTAVAVGLLAYRYREPTRDRLLTPRRAAAVAALALPVALAGTAVFETGSLSRFVTGPASATVVASGVLAGVFAAQRRWALLAAATIGIGLLATAAIAGALGVAGLFFGPLAICVGVVAGVVPFGYGYWFAPTASRESPE
ncbi:hypothetical protein C463_14880 [Halorubrum californiense DSM 19288]|uniref:Uncharacterized protein n=1 Tax=Halorubrum californiense DSM 19288 TaxID=1227465 RepID=M0E0Y5_9EURY|nr:MULTISPECIES: hypothetical protein [Halorubrum]ELZ40602.1 hypothetical protein C463_14880 [Halorubrum californiense DSM 19288]TKX66506.1 hypothetical protein EXE40_15960 [Halorubrum sp. GN11GM_10-3_MGM]